MSKFYTAEMKDYIFNNYKGKTIRQLQADFNKKFNTNVTYHAMKSYLGKWQLKVGHSNRKYRDEHIEFLRENVKGITLRELTNRFNKKFNMNVNESAISNLKTKYNLASGIVGGQFPKGHIPANKGKKGYMSKEQYEKCKATMFKKGNMPQNHRPVGSERIDQDGYTYIKVAEPNKWKLKHRLLWEQHKGPIPPKHRLIFADGNRQNICLENLILVSYAESLIMSKRDLFSENAEFTRTGVNIAKVLNKAKAR